MYYIILYYIILYYIILYIIYISLLKSENVISFKIPSCQTPVGLGTCSMSGRALHRQPRVGSPQPQEEVLRPAGVRNSCRTLWR